MLFIITMCILSLLDILSSYNEHNRLSMNEFRYRFNNDIIGAGGSGEQAEADYEEDYNELLTHPIDVHLDYGETAGFLLYLKKPPTEKVLVNWTCEGELGCKTFDPKITFPQDIIVLTAENYNIQFNMTSTIAGHDVIIFEILNNINYIEDRLAFVRIRVGKGPFWWWLAQFWGWGYFMFWSVSFWPQNITNYQRKSVVGLSFDFTILHFTGFLYYGIFIITLYYSKVVQAQYEEKFPRSEIPVEFNDVVYVLHATFSSGITFFQLFYYEKGNQSFALVSKLFQLFVWVIGAILFVLCIFDECEWLTLIYYFSYLKLFVTTVKYFPQLYFNYQRKSTRGWTIYMILCDVSGGIFSIMQMITIAFNYNDWITLIGNFPKLGLAIVSVLNDLVFLVQHYILYAENNRIAKIQEELDKQMKLKLTPKHQEQFKLKHRRPSPSPFSMFISSISPSPSSTYGSDLMKRIMMRMNNNNDKNGKKRTTEDEETDGVGTSGRGKSPKVLLIGRDQDDEPTRSSSDKTNTE